MQITLKCKYDNGSVAFPQERIDGLPVESRHYDIAGGIVILMGEDAIVHHDVEVLLNMPDNLYRMLTPAEQDLLIKQSQQASTVQENTESSVEVPNTTGQSSAPDVAEQNTAPLDSPPAQQKKKAE